jgi:hypothetical protein
MKYDSVKWICQSHHGSVASSCVHDNGTFCFIKGGEGLDHPTYCYLSRRNRGLCSIKLVVLHGFETWPLYFEGRTYIYRYFETKCF